MRRLLQNAIIQALLLVLLLTTIQLLLGPAGMWLAAKFWLMALVAWIAFIPGFWFYHRYFEFWRLRHPIYPLVYGAVIVLAYAAYAWSFFLKYPIHGFQPLSEWHPWLFFLAGMSIILMFSPTVLSLNRLFAKRLLLRSILGLIIVATLAYPYFKRQGLQPERPHLLLKVDTTGKSIDLQNYNIRAIRYAGQVHCSEKDIQLWQMAPAFVPYYWFLASPFTSQPLCIAVDELEQKTLDQHSWTWNQSQVIVWRNPDWERLPDLLSYFDLVILENQSVDEDWQWRLYDGSIHNGQQE